MDKQTFKISGSNRAVSLDMSRAEAVQHMGGDEYTVTISGVDYRIIAPNTNAETLHGSKGVKGADKA